MRKTLLFSIMVLLFAISNLNAKTIWLKDLTDNNFGKFYNAIWEDLKETQYGKNYKYVTENKKINKKEGDIIIEFSGMDMGSCGLCAMIVISEVSSDLSWNYRTSTMHAFTYEYTIDQARESRKKITTFLKENF